MASFIFEEGTQTNASGFQNGDTLIFKTATPTSLDVTYNVNGGFSVPTITLTSGTTSLEFAASALSAGTKQFLAGGSLVIGTTGNDTLASVTTPNASAVYGLDGNDSITVSATATATNPAAHLIDLGAGDDTITAGGSGAYFLQGGAGLDTIDASASTGNLHIYGNVAGGVQGATDGADTITLGSGASYVNGNAGNDVITVAAAVVAAGGGATNVNSVRLNGGAGNDTITGGNGADTINGNLGDDSITGGAGDDFLRGGQGNDTIIGGTGNNQLFGDLGNDTLSGGAGVDVFTGGAGNDVFLFNAGDAPVQTATALVGFFDEIKDFTHGSDKIDIAGVTVATTTNTVLLQAAGATFTTESAAHVYAQQLIDNANTATAQSATVHYTAVIQVGSDSYLYSSDTNTAGITTSVKLDGVTASTITSSDII